MTDIQEIEPIAFINGALHYQHAADTLADLQLDALEDILPLCSQRRLHLRLR